jgi:outer membrane protein assembly factor BamB
VLRGDCLFLVNDNEEQSSLLALNKYSGEVVWQVERDERSNWATPLIWENSIRTEIVTSGARRVRSYALDGKVLWELGGMSAHTVPTPCALQGLLYVSSGPWLDFRRPVFAIRPGASGDISLAPGQTTNAFIAWWQLMAGAYVPSPIVYRDYLYILYDRGMLACYDAKTGKEVYGKTRIGERFRTFTASPWAYEGKVFCLSEDGVAFVVQAGPKLSILRTNPIDELCMATPAVAHRSLILRTETALYRIEDRGPEK